ncbi:Phosphotransferase enzyme family [Aspergillus sclerotialis]|uniref:Phosphotransferase enzyme family n=1 Tax=Aspergillus sclerotialis TaxID=2070753 RepID=A0A3A2ZQ01_9EURO|nr:Phosphotransferase enzyme family [Aspergillus sclerotialis]
MAHLSFHEENISFAISQFRSDQQLPNLSGHFDGGQCRVFTVDFEDEESWAVRVPLFVRNASRDAVISLVQCEANVLRELENKGFRWAAKLRGCSLTFDNAVGYPFIALTWIPGSPLSWSEDFLTRPFRDKILSQVAMIHVSLIQCIKENGRLPEITEQDCFDQRNILSDILYPELDDAPFAMDHGDLSPQNILVDSEFNITGIIDWGFSAKVPFQMAAGFPRFLRLQPPLLPPNPVLQKDRESYNASLKAQSSQQVSWMILVQSSRNVDFQIFVLDSIVSKGMHRWLASNGWKLPSRKLRGIEGDNRQRECNCDSFRTVRKYFSIACICGMTIALGWYLREQYATRA